MRFFSFQELTARQIAVRLLFYFLVMSALAVGVVCAVNAAKWLNKPFPGFLVNQRLNVGYMGQYHWTGTQAGLKSPDKIIKADGRTLASAVDLDEAVKAAGEGQPITYVVSRSGKEITVTVPTMRFSAMDLALIAGILFFLGILYLIIGIVVYFLKPDNIVSWILFSGCLLLGVSCFMSFDMESTHFGFVRAYLLVDTILPAFIFHLSMLFPERLQLVRRWPALQTMPYILSALLVAPIQLAYPGPMFGSIYQFVLIYLILGALAVVGSSLHAYFWYSSTLARQRARVILLGAAVALPVPALVPLVSFLGGTFGGIQVVTNFSALPTMIFPASVAYAIAKHNLFDVDVYIKRAVGYGVMTALVGASYFALQLVVRNVILKPVFGGIEESVSQVLFTVLVVIILFGPVSRKIQDRVDRLFFRKKFSYRDTVLSVSNALSSMLDLDEIVRKIIITVRTEMFIDSGGIILMNPGSSACQALFIRDAEKETGEAESRDVCLLANDPLISLIAREKKIITKYDIQEDPVYASCREACGRRFTEMNASLAIPLVYQNEVTGILALGRKKSGHFYSREDIDLLSTLAGQGAVAVENARLAEQMKEEEKKRANLSRYLSPHVVDQVMKKDVQINMGGNRKEVTILFSDIRHFTRISESFPPDRLVEILNEYFTEMAAIIFKYRGSLDKYIGDAIIAVFDSLIPLEHPEQSAAHTAIAMMKRIEELNEGWKRRFGFEMSIGIGINSGEVFLGTVGAPQRMEFAVIGDPVNVAARLSGLAEGGQILVTREVSMRLNSGMQCSTLPPVELKGKTGLMEICEICYD